MHRGKPVLVARGKPPPRESQPEHTAKELQLQQQPTQKSCHEGTEFETENRSLTYTACAPLKTPNE
jgi:hypothetical protein